MKEISNAAGRDIAFTPVTMDEYEKTLREYGVPEDHIWLITYLFAEVLTDENSRFSDDIPKVLGRKAKDFTEYAGEAAESGIWNEVK